MDTHFITYVATQSLAGLTRQPLERALRMLAPDWIETVELFAGAGEVPNIVRINGLPLALMAVGVPLPPDAWSEAARRSVIFTDASAVMQRTSAHVIVASMASTPDHAGAVSIARAVTLAAAAVAMVTEADAIVFTWSQAILQAGTVITAAGSISRGELPVMFWTSFQFFRGPLTASGTESFGAVTTGMLPFLGREIEFSPAAIATPQLAERVLNLCHFLLAQGPVIRDGETIGNTHEEKIRASTRDQGQRPGIPVLHFAVETLGSPPPAPEPVPFVQPITPAARFAARPEQGQRVFGKRRWTGS